MDRIERNASAGAKLREIRERLGLSVRDVHERSLLLCAQRKSDNYKLSRAWVTEVEKGRFVPASVKMASLCAIYGIAISEVQKMYGIDPTDVRAEHPYFGPPKTYLLSPSEVPREDAGGGEDRAKRTKVGETNLVTRLIDRWGALPVPLLRKFVLKRSVYGYIGVEDFTMSPLLVPGTFVQIDVKQNYIRKSFSQPAGQSHFARPIYFLDVRTGYACGYCELKDKILTLIPYPDSGESIRTFRYPDEVTIVGRVTHIAMCIEEENIPIKNLYERKKPTKK
jgi:transcriptional regulator with XRE-family HTH domain